MSVHSVKSVDSDLAGVTVILMILTHRELILLSLSVEYRHEETNIQGKGFRV